jgi:hypothetical protein
MNNTGLFYFDRKYFWFGHKAISRDIKLSMFKTLDLILYHQGAIPTFVNLL